MAAAAFAVFAFLATLCAATFFAAACFFTVAWRTATECDTGRAAAIDGMAAPPRRAAASMEL